MTSTMTTVTVRTADLQAFMQDAGECAQRIRNEAALWEGAGELERLRGKEEADKQVAAARAQADMIDCRIKRLQQAMS